MKPELLNYLKQNAKEPFDIETNNCIQFTNHCWKIYHGHYWGEEYMNISSFEDTDLSDPLLGADKYLERTEKPQEGHLVAVAGLFVTLAQATEPAESAYPALNLNHPLHLPEL